MTRPPRTLSSGRQPRSAGAFTLIELVVCLGVIMILVGLLMPTVGVAYSRARLTRELAVVRQHAIAIDAYASDSAGVYPLIGPLAFPASTDWWKCLVAAGHYQSIGDVDPAAASLGLPRVSYIMSLAMVYDHAKMAPGETVPIGEAFSCPVRQDQVIFPSAKALAFKWYEGNEDPAQGGLVYCCGGAPWEFPIALASDGAAVSGTYLSLNGGQPPYIENSIGIPVYTTWFGCRGRDLQ